MVLLSTPYPFLSCPFHSAGSSRTTYVPRASELVATAGRSLDYALSFFHHHLHIPSSIPFRYRPSVLLSLSLSLYFSRCHHYQPFSLSLSLSLCLCSSSSSSLDIVPSHFRFRSTALVSPRQATLSRLFYSLSSLLCALRSLPLPPTDFYVISSLHRASLLCLEILVVQHFCLLAAFTTFSVSLRDFSPSLHTHLSLSLSLSLFLFRSCDTEFPLSF